MKTMFSFAIRARSLLLIMPLFAIVSMLTGCGGDDDDDNGKRAQIRLLNVSPGYESLDVYVNDGDATNDTTVLTGVTYETASAYASLDADTYSVKFKRNGVSGTLATLSSDNLSGDSHALYVAYGSNSRFRVTKIGEDVDDADSQKTKMNVLNTSEAGALDVYFTEDSVALDDAAAAVTSLASGSLSSQVTLDSDTYRLRVTGANDKSDVRLDVSGITLNSKQVVSLILTATQGGVLVNAMLVPQQGELSKKPNTRARVRGAVGINGGTSVTASIGGVGLLTSAAVGVISTKYVQVTAGNAAVSLRIDGNPVTVADQTLTAGGDYTFLMWSDASGTRTTLVNDDNRLPVTSGKAKIRLLNGISGLGVPTTLAVDFSPLAEGIELGAASGYTEIDGGSDDYQIDVSNSSTAASLYSKSSVSLQEAGVYTMFMWGGGTAAVSGTLRKDR